jgi:hypothetical protein
MNRKVDTADETEDSCNCHQLRSSSIHVVVGVIPTPQLVGPIHLFGSGFRCLIEARPKTIVVGNHDVRSFGQ